MIKSESIQNTIDSVNYCIAQIETLLEQKESILDDTEISKNDLADLHSKIEFLNSTKQYYVKAVDIMYEESIGALKETLNTALQYIMYDKNYACNLVLEDKRGTKNLYISLVDLDEDFEVDLKDGVGQGVRTIISFVLKTYYLINQNSKLLFLDEKYSALSEHYVPRFFEFMKRMAGERDMIIVIITHDSRFMEYADKTYVINDGHATIVEEDNGHVLEQKQEETGGKLQGVSKRHKSNGE